MARPFGVIGIDLGTDTIKAVLLGVFPGEDVPRVLGVAAATSQGMRRGNVLEPSVTAQSLMQALDLLAKSTELKTRRHYVGIGGVGLGCQKAHGLVAISRADGEVSPEDAKRAIAASEASLQRTQNRDILHRIPLIYRIDNDTTAHDPIGLSGIKLEAETLFITAFSQNTKAVLKLIDEARCDAEELIANPYALSYSVLSKREKEAGVMALDIGASTTSLIIFEEGLPYSLEIIPLGSGHITNDIATGFQIGIDEAEKLKINYGAIGNITSSNKKDDLVYGNYSKRKLSDIIEARLSDIFELVEKHLKKVGRAGLLPSGIVLTGGGANLPGIIDFVKNYLMLPTRITSVENIGGFKDKVNNPTWSAAVGIAMIGLSRKGNSTIFRGAPNKLLKWFRAFLP